MRRGIRFPALVFDHGQQWLCATAEDALMCLSQSDLVCAQQVQIELSAVVQIVWTWLRSRFGMRSMRVIMPMP